MDRLLTLDDVLDLREYERQRVERRAEVIAAKRPRRVQIGPVVSVLFESRQTVWFQVQEMVRAEAIATDEAVQAELDAYNPLVPGPGELSATLFLELTDEPGLREWLPRLVGIERSLELWLTPGVPPAPLTPAPPQAAAGGLGDGIVRATPEPGHEAALTRQSVTSAVHYLRFALDPAQVEAFADQPVHLAVAHREYRHAVLLEQDTKASLLQDLRP